MQVRATLTVVKTIAERLKQAREDKKLTQPELADRSGVSQGTIGNVEAGLRKNPRELLAIAAALDVEPEWLKTGKGPRQRSSVETAPDLRPGTRVPVVGSVKGGPDGYMEELQYPVGVGEGFVEYWTPDKAAYALRVKGDSMHPRYRAGEFIVVTPSIEPQPGRDVVVKLKSGQKLLKQLNWIKSGEVQLLSINNGYAPMTIDITEIEGIDRVGGSVPPDSFSIL